LNYFLGFKDKAKESFLEALRLNPQLSEALTNLGNLLYEEEQYEDACYKFLEALDID